MKRVTKKAVADLSKAVRNAQRAAYRDSNDGEIERLSYALDLALDMLKRLDIVVVGLTDAERLKCEEAMS